MTHWIDTHTHIDICEREQKAQQKLLESCQLNIKKLVTVSTGIDSYFNGKKLALNNPNFVYTSCGLYPSHAENYNDRLKEMLIEQLDEGIAIALGEVGLDYYRNYADAESQKRLFIDQIRLAKEYDLPLIIHARDSIDDVYQILKSEKPQKAGVMHCFAGNENDVLRFIDLGFYISFAGNVTYKKAVALQQSCKATPINRLVLETDAPYLTPEPHRGKRNTPSQIAHTGDFVARLKEMSVQDLCKHTCDNAIQLFSLK